MPQQTFDFRYLTDIGDITGNFLQVRVVDKRNDTTTMGYVRNNSYIKDIVATPSVAKCLENYYHSILNAGNSMDTLLVILRGLKMEHNPTATEQGTIYIYADYFSGRNDKYKLLLTVDSFYEVPPGSLPASMLKRYQALMDNYIKIAAGKEVEGMFYSVADAVMYHINRKQKLPVYEKNRLCKRYLQVLR